MQQRATIDRSSGQAPPDGSAGDWPAEDLESLGHCPVCGATDREILHAGLRDRVFRCAPGAWTLHGCRGCGIAYLDPRPTEATIDRAYASYYTHWDQRGVVSPLDREGGSGLLSSMWRRARNGYLHRRLGYDVAPRSATASWVAPLFRKRLLHALWWLRYLPAPAAGSRLLDVGCGGGDFLLTMRGLGWEVCGVDPDPGAVAAAGSHGLDVRLGSAFRDDLAVGGFDAITLHHVIEHVHDPAALLLRCRELLSPSGALFVATPNLNAAGHRRFGPEWFGLETPRHLTLFTESRLRALIAAAGFAGVTRVPSRPWRGYFAQSRAIALGADPMVPPPLPRALAWRAWRADHPLRPGGRAGEEIGLMARLRPVAG